MSHPLCQSTISSHLATCNPQLDYEPLFGGALYCGQPKHGYRFSMDPVLLANFISPAADEKNALDLGAGCGIISLLLCHLHPQLAVTALEIQEDLVWIIRHNIEFNGLEKRLNCVAGDICKVSDLLKAGSYDLVFANPPYAARGASRPSKNRQCAIARHEITVQMADVLAAAFYALRPGGRAAFIYPMARLVELEAGLIKNGLTPTAIDKVPGRSGGPPKLVLVAARKGIKH